MEQSSAFEGTPEMHHPLGLWGGRYPIYPEAGEEGKQMEEETQELCENVIELLHPLITPSPAIAPPASLCTLRVICSGVGMPPSS